MNTQTVIRKAHRWLGVGVGIQLLFWTVSGLYFSLIPIEEIRGEHLTHEANEPLVDLPAGLAAPGAVVQSLKAAQIGFERLESLDLLRRGQRLFYRAEFQSSGQNAVRLVDASSGVLEPLLDEPAARERAKQLFQPQVPVLAAEYFTEVAPDSEYRGKPLPAWRVTFDHPSRAALYLTAATGELTARRTDAWRVFDFLWMLHILDFEARDDFNQWLLRGLSILGVITIVSGFVLWVVTTPLLRRRRRAS